MLSRRVLLCVVVATIALSSAVLWAAKEFVMPQAANANTYPSKDAHPNEKVAAAIDVYNSAPKDDIFITHYGEEGILPVFLIITNDGDQPIIVKNMRAELVTSSRTKLSALDVDDVFRRVAHIKGSSSAPPRIGPIQLGGNKNKKAQQQYDEIMRAHFAAEAVEPHTTKSGFLFFDVQSVKNPVAGSNIYLTGINDNRGNELMYFEIPVIASNAAAPGGQ
jgi:hypothetical protein